MVTAETLNLKRTREPGIISRVEAAILERMKELLPVWVDVEAWPEDTNDFDSVVTTVTASGAVTVLAEKKGRRRQTAQALKELGEHPESGGPVNIMDGRYGPYVKWEKVNATLPKDVEPANVTMDMAVALIAEKAAKKGGRKKKASPMKTTAAK